ncbi:MAG TPA: nucleotidyl transferase AbiEii/AbiGii toxin family protein [Kiritimatiellia bacterium]|nr:nucleotidyl transferase AbiEii/AbiGii toxin family protein [Kiritimatiellia bacterium]HMO99365.1 nucleotidyl transferase AbiEii/AbiGii toxin family protein [Kiritimatiellia bacterium]HMP95648.1 nucleotidyl transferase AbiEii/AbiGii toxin family protein [Kiritimatiellia bacterium]
MFPAEYQTAEWIGRQRLALGRCDPGILEKCVLALTLLGRLVETGLPFLFKGGTSLLLHLPEPRRLSRDIDIVCGESAEKVDAALEEVGRQAPFIRHEPDPRDDTRMPRRRHFKFFYRSALKGNAESEVLLDVVEEAHEAHDAVMRPIRTNVLIPEREILVRVPTVESLLGDKLTAFAPNTVGVRLRRPDGLPGDVQQVAKQLFDVGVLMDVATDFDAVARTYDQVHSLENGYRGGNHTREASLDDTINACLAIMARKKVQLDQYPDAPLLHDGFERMKGHLTWPAFSNTEARRTLAAKAAALAAHLKAGVPFDFIANRYSASAEQLAHLKATSLNGTPHSWLEGVRSTNPESYHYWVATMRALGHLPAV